MKYFLLLMICYVAVLTATSAQEYRPTVVQAAQWNRYEWFEAGRTRIEKIDGDTLINELVYNKLSDSYSGVSALLQEDTAAKKIYIRINDTNNVLYDYSLNVGDTFQAPELLGNFINERITLVLDSVTDNLSLEPLFTPNPVTMYIDNPKVYYFRSLDNLGAGPVIWVEGVGSMTGVLHPGFAPPNIGSGNSIVICHFLDVTNDYHFNGLYFFGRSDSCVWATVGIEKINSNKVILNIHPNPAADRVKVGITGDNVKIFQLRINDITGKMYLQETIYGTKEVDTHLWPPGMYLVRITTNDGAIRVRKLMIAH